MNITMICRLCSKQCLLYVDIFYEKIENVDLSEIIYILFSIKVKDTHISKVMCVKCFDLVKIFYNFYVIVKNAQKHISMQVCPEQNDFCLETKLENEQHEGQINYSEIKEELSDREFISGDDYNTNYNKKHIDGKKEYYIPLETNVITTKRLKKNKLKPKLRRKIHNIKTDLLESKEDDILTLNKLSNNCMDIEKCEDKSIDLNSKPAAVCSKKNNEIIKNGKLIVTGHALNELHKSFYNILCDKCEDLPRFDNLEMMFNHYMNKHSKPGYVKCCDTYFYNVDKINSHIVTHLQPSFVECPICQKKITTKKSLTVHLQTHLPMSKRRYPCDQCEKGFVQICQLKSHKQLHLPIEQRNTYLCEQCGKSFYTVLSRNNHVKSVHSTSEYLCAECGKAFKTKVFLLGHIRRLHEPDGDPKMKCIKCDVVCKKSSIKVHMKIHEEKGIQCELCEYTTFSKRNINAHINRKHSKVKPYECTLCPKSFKIKLGLQHHMAQHTGVHKYSCEYCPKTFASSGNYFTHRKRMHAENLLHKKQIQNIKQVQVYNPDKQEADRAHDLDLLRTELKKIKFKTPLNL